jgi:hypothetical protein
VAGNVSANASAPTPVPKVNLASTPSGASPGATGFDEATNS